MKNTTPIEHAAKALIKHLDPMTIAANSRIDDPKAEVADAIGLARWWLMRKTSQNPAV